MNEEHKCDECGCSPEELWTGHKIDGYYCFKHFKDLHSDDKEAFEAWCKEFKVC